MLVLLVGLVFTLGGVAGTFDTIQRYRRMKAWPRTNGRIEKIDKRYVSNGGGGEGSGRTVYHVHYSFSSAAGGRRFAGHSEEGSALMAEGDQIEIMHDPDSPEINDLPDPLRLWPTCWWGFLALCGTGMIAGGVIGVLQFVGALPQPSRF